MGVPGLCRHLRPSPVVRTPRRGLPNNKGCKAILSSEAVLPLLSAEAG